MEQVARWEGTYFILLLEKMDSQVSLLAVEVIKVLRSSNNPVE